MREVVRKCFVGICKQVRLKPRNKLEFESFDIDTKDFILSTMHQELMEKKDNKQCLLDTPRRVPVIKDSYQNTKCQ